MGAQPRGGVVRRWVGSESTPVRRALVAGPIGAAALVLSVALVEATGLSDWAFIWAALVIAVGFGAFVRGWVAVPVAYVGLVLVAWIAETATFLYLGGGEWEARNSEHWQGNDPASMKLLGQLLEYLVAIVLVVPFVALGVVISRGGQRLFRGPEQRWPLGT